MNQLFGIGSTFQIPDGTMVSPFLNARDVFSDLPFDLLDSFSIAAGEIPPSVKSKIHIHPVVTQVTFVWQGKVTVTMKDRYNKNPYAIPLEPGQAVLTKAGTFFQLSNTSERSCRVLYIVSPAYVFLMNNNEVVYDDALVLDERWEALPQTTAKLYSVGQYRRNRKKALAEVEKLKSGVRGSGS